MLYVMAEVGVIFVAFVFTLRVMMAVIHILPTQILVLSQLTTARLLLFAVHTSISLLIV